MLLFRILMRLQRLLHVLISLKNIQMVSATTEDDLISIVPRFRKHPFVVSAHVVKMHGQVLINPGAEKRNLQLIVWHKVQLNHIMHCTKY